MAQGTDRSKSVELLEALRLKYLHSRKLQALIKPAEIEVLDEFVDNWDRIEEFYTHYYSTGFPRTVLCGLNPGRLGAGKTGIPFIDFSSLSELLVGVRRQDKERSAQFFFQIVSQFGAERFFKAFYVTNVSWVGYRKGAKNVNYPDLPPQALAFVKEMFQFEMSVVRPVRIISLSDKVQQTVSELFATSDIDTSLRLQHPNYCAFPKNLAQSTAEYLAQLSKHCD